MLIGRNFSVLKTGDIITVDFTYSDQSKTKRRPAVIIDNFKDDLLVAYFTQEVNKYQHETTAVIIASQDIDKGFIKHTSLIRLQKLAFIHQDLCKWVARITNKKQMKYLENLPLFQQKHMLKQKKENELFLTPGQTYHPPVRQGAG